MGPCRGENKLAQSREEIIALVLVFNFFVSEGYLAEASRNVREREPGTKRFQTEVGMGNEPPSAQTPGSQVQGRSGDVK